jgi:hypothetical protein
MTALSTLTTAALIELHNEIIEDAPGVSAVKTFHTKTAGVEKIEKLAAKFEAVADRLKAAGFEVSVSAPETPAPVDAPAVDAAPEPAADAPAKRRGGRKPDPAVAARREAEAAAVAARKAEREAARAAKAAAPAKVLTVDDLALKAKAVIWAIARSEYTANNGGEPSSAAGTATWHNQVEVAGLATAAVSQIIRGLVSRKLATLSGSGNDLTVCLTDAGFDLYKALGGAQPVIPTTEAKPYTPRVARADGARKWKVEDETPRQTEVSNVMIALMKRPEGATQDDMSAALGWKRCGDDLNRTIYTRNLKPRTEAVPGKGRRVRYFLD